MNNRKSSHIRPYEPSDLEPLKTLTVLAFERLPLARYYQSLDEG